MLLIAFPQRANQRQSGDRDNGCAERAEQDTHRRQRGAFARVVRQKRQHGAERNVDEGIEKRQAQVGDKSVDQLTGGAEIRHVEGQNTQQSEGKRADQQVWTTASPAGGGVVDNQPHQHIGNAVHQTRNEEHQTNVIGGQSHHVGIKEHQIKRDHLPHKVAGEVGDAIAKALPPQGKGCFCHKNTLAYRCC